MTDLPSLKMLDSEAFKFILRAAINEINDILKKPNTEDSRETLLVAQLLVRAHYLGITKTNDKEDQDDFE